MPFKLFLAMECLVAIFAFMWEIERLSRLLRSDSANMLFLGEMFSQPLLALERLIAVAAMIAQCFLVGVLSIAVTAVIWSRMQSISYMSKVFCKIWEVNITFVTVAMLCDPFMLLQFRRTKISLFTLLALWMLLPFMLKDCVSLWEMKLATWTVKRLNGRRSRRGDWIGGIDNLSRA